MQKTQHGAHIGSRPTIYCQEVRLSLKEASLDRVSRASPEKDQDRPVAL